MYCLEYFNIIPLHLESQFCFALEYSCFGGGITDIMDVNSDRLQEMVKGQKGLERCSLRNHRGSDTTGRPNKNK